MTKEERDEALRRMRAHKNNGQTEPETDEGKTYPTADKPRWSDFEKDAAAAVAELRKTMGAKLGNTVIADDRSRADKKPHELMKEAEEVARLEPDQRPMQPANENVGIIVAERPAEKLGTGQLDYTRWNRVKAEIDMAHMGEHFGEVFYHQEVLARSRKEEELRTVWWDNPGEPRAKLTKEFEAKYEAWRDEEIENGIRDGFLKRDEKGRVTAVEREKDRPGEKLVTRRIRRTTDRQDDGGRGGPE